jgi:hypothetical protein
MKSPMVENADYIEDQGNYTELMVLHSPAGYYVGTMYNNPDGYQEPGSRDSSYFKKFGDAEKFLESLNKGSQEAINELRMNP